MEFFGYNFNNLILFSTINIHRDIMAKNKIVMLNLKVRFMKKVVLLLSCLFISMGLAIAQDKTVSGTVIDETGEPIIGASVFAKGTTTGTVTDIEGKFSFSIPISVTTLVVKYLGMETLEAPAEANVQVTLTSDTKALNEVIVTGYGVTRKVAFTGSAQTIESKMLIKTTDADPVRSLAGSVAGLQIMSETGQPGGFNTVLIRGLGSYNSGTQPLYVIDGIPMTTDKFGVRQEENATLNPLSGLNVNDIESVSVLKDAAATSIYGARASNGVIVITTKKGKQGGTKVNFTAKMGTSMLPQRNEYRMLNAEKWYDFENQLLHNSGFLNELLDTSKPEDRTVILENVLELIDANPNTDTDWYKAVTRSGFTQNYNLEISGGDQKTKYFISGGYYDEAGIIIGKDLERYSGRVNVETQISKYLSAGVNLFGSYQKMNHGAGGGYFSDPITQALMQLPVEEIKKPDGSWNMNTLNGYNPVAQRSELGDKNQAKQYKAIISPWVKINFAKDFTFLSKYGMDFYNTKEFGLWSMLQPQGADMNMLGEEANTYSVLWTWTNTLNYLKSFGRHNINIMLGQEVQKATKEEAYLAASNYPTNVVITVENAAVPSDAATTYDNYALASCFLNAEYDYNQKYYLSVSARRDGSSRFGENHKWATFGSVGAKYRIINESFMEDLKKISNLTLRASYGTTGNQDIGWYQALGLYRFGYKYKGRPGMIPYQIVNPNLKWEQMGKLNVGVELGLFNKFSLEVEYYNNHTTDMLFEVPLSRTTGSASTMQNVGEMRNTGFEAVIGYIPVKTKDIMWSLSLNITHNKNEIVKLSTDKPIESTYTIREVGRPYYSFKMKEYAGVDPETGEQLWYAGEEGTETTANYNDAGKRYLGDADPEFFGGFSSNLQAYNFDLSFLFNYSFGGKIYNSAARYDENINNIYGNTTEYVYNNMWRKPGDITDVPAPTDGAITSHSSRFLMDGSYIKLQNIQLGYNLPEKLLSRINLSGVRVYLSGENLKMWALGKNFRGVTPEAGVDGILWWNYPMSRKVMFGLNINF
jgi:TonB-linked SusC/RagA family outer membrane protein